MQSEAKRTGEQPKPDCWGFDPSKMTCPAPPQSFDLKMKSFQDMRRKTAMAVTNQLLAQHVEQLFVLQTARTCLASPARSINHGSDA